MAAERIAMAGAIVAMVSCMLIPTSAISATATASIAVTASAQKTCTVSATAIAFGNYDPIVANLNADLMQTGTITLTCTKGTTTSIGIDTGANGTHAVGATRAMFSGTDYLSYDVYQDSARTVVWGNSGSGLLTPAAAPSNSPRTFTTYGNVGKGQTVTAGSSYSDTLTVTVIF